MPAKLTSFVYQHLEKVCERYTSELTRVMAFDDYEYPDELPNLKKNFEALCDPRTNSKAVAKFLAPSISAYQPGLEQAR